MSKYDFEIDLSEHTSTGKILSKIEKGSVVLEFGCANGRMTKHMKENMGCQVYIVEYDQGAYEEAKQFAVDGLCEDIMKFGWAEKFSGIAFDAIIFADVLEHLSNPERVLEKAGKLLKHDGCIYVSIPNITHNDIVLKAMEERFDYTETG
ncbi:MAG: class I SAM-dependent methyltransferase, partial [Lachnospiraceae bacterium]|nr:class I SAM-dependent methyltransferase [Lachnospiraceae bacterium]